MRNQFMIRCLARMLRYGDGNVFGASGVDGEVGEVGGGGRRKSWGHHHMFVAASNFRRIALPSAISSARHPYCISFLAFVLISSL
jgi:hypothetical protein